MQARREGGQGGSLPGGPARPGARARPGWGPCLAIRLSLSRAEQRGAARGNRFGVAEGKVCSV